VELGITERERKAVFPFLLKTKKNETKDMVYTEPFIRIKVKHRGWTPGGFLRLPVLDEIIV
jgi:DNA ligase 1